MNGSPRLLFFFLVLISVTACNLLGWENSTPPLLLPEAELDSIQTTAVTAIRRELDRQENAGMYGVVRLQCGDSVLIYEVYGWQDREAERPMKLDSGFDIGSIVKAITAATIFKLEEDGLLRTTDTVGQFFPEAPPKIQAITIDQLLAHTAGLPEYLGGDYDLLDREEALNRIFGSRLRFVPGTDKAYSNTGYTLLALIVEAAAGLPYEQAVREAVLVPAGTPGIGYRLAGWTQNRLAVGYYGRRGRRRWGTPLDHAWLDDGPSWTLRGNGGMLATVDDLAQWFDAMFTGRVLGPDALSRFSALYASADAYGLRIGEAGGNDVFNALHEEWVDLGVNLTFFTSVSSRSAEQVWHEISDEMDMLVQIAAQTDRHSHQGHSH